MKIMMDVVDNIEMRHYEVQTEAGLEIIEYQIQEKKVFLTKAELSEEFIKSGQADEMIKTVLEVIKDKEFKVVPMCKYPKAYFKSHREARALLPKGLHLI